MYVPNKSRLTVIQELDLPGFYRYRPYGVVRHRFLSNQPVKEQFDRFVSRLVQAKGQLYLPVYRMADGEFSFLVGPRPSVFRAKVSLRERLAEYYIHVVSRLGSGQITTCWGEHYAKKELHVFRSQIQHRVQYIAQEGLLGLYFAIRDDHWGEQYFVPICSWLDNSQIILSENNYIPFYFVYAVLNGPSRRTLLTNAKVLVITHLSPERVEAIETGLRADGARCVQFLNISANRSVAEVLDLSSVKQPVDLVLVAAGIGSANILAQLKELRAPCIDCGISLDCYINPYLRWKRAFLLDDDRYSTRASLSEVLTS